MFANSVNRVTLMGNVGKEPERKFLPNGTAVARFSLATVRNWKDKSTDGWKKETDWHNIKVFGHENVVEKIFKGILVFVEGSIRTRSYDNKEGVKVYVTEIVADGIAIPTYNSGDSEGSSAGRARPAAVKPSSADSAKDFDSQPDWGSAIDDEDIPF